MIVILFICFWLRFQGIFAYFYDYRTCISYLYCETLRVSSYSIFIWFSGSRCSLVPYCGYLSLNLSLWMVWVAWVYMSTIGWDLRKWFYDKILKSYVYRFGNGLSRLVLYKIGLVLKFWVTVFKPVIRTFSLVVFRHGYLAQLSSD